MPPRKPSADPAPVDVLPDRRLDQLRLAYTHTLLLTGRHWRRAANAVMEAHGLSDATAVPLIMIARLDGAPRQNALAEAVGIEGPSLVRLLDQLCEAGRLGRKTGRGWYDYASGKAEASIGASVMPAASFR